MDKLVFSAKAIDSQLAEIIAAGGRVCLVVTGTSMRPFLEHSRDMVCLRPWEEKDIKCGQILLFQREDRALVLHRVRKVLPNGKLRMNGDGQTWCETITREQIIAVVSSVERKGQRISCNSAAFRLWNWFWYPTRPVRHIMFKLCRLLFPRKKGRHDLSG